MWGGTLDQDQDGENEQDEEDDDDRGGDKYKYIILLLANSGLHKLWYPCIRDTSTWSKFGAHGEHGDVFLFSNLGAPWFSENLIRYSLHVC